MSAGDQWGAEPGGAYLRPRSGAVTAVGIINLILGGLTLICGLVAMFAASLIFGGGAQAIEKARLQGIDIKDQQAASGLIAMFAGMAVVFGIIIILIAALYIIAGIGVLNRKNYGRIITLILGVLAGVGALLAIPGLGQAPGSALMQILLNGGYCVLVFVVLLNARNAAEFR